MPRVYFAMEVLHRGFLSCLELLLSSKLQVREKIKCEVLERVCVIGLNVVASMLDSIRFFCECMSNFCDV